MKHECKTYGLFVITVVTFYNALSYTFRLIIVILKEENKKLEIREYGAFDFKMVNKI
jgi:hypothetical protein